MNGNTEFGLEIRSPGWGDHNPTGMDYDGMVILNYLRSAETALQRGDVAAAAELCSKALKESPEDVDARMLAAVIAIKQNQAVAAIGWLEGVLSQDKDHLGALKWLSVAMRMAHRYADAITVGETARALQPNDPEILASLGLSYRAARNLGSATKCLIRAIEIRPDDASLRTELGACYELSGADSSAVEQYRKAIKLAPKAERAYVQLGKLLMGHGNFREAIELGEVAIRALPNSAQVKHLCAQSYRAVQDWEQAKAHLESAIALDPRLALTKAKWLTEDGEFSKASQIYEDSIRRTPIQGEAYAGLAKGRRITADDRELIDAMGRVIREPNLHPRERAALSYALGKAHNDLAEYEAAMRHFDAGNRLNFEFYLSGRTWAPEAGKRAINRMKERFPAEALTRNQSNASASDRPIFIVGMIRSGTTLVEQILSSHPEVAAGGEQKFWVSEAPRFVARPAEALKELSDRYLQLLSASQNGKPRVTDKEPMNYLWLGLIHQAFPHPRIVHVMREPVDNALSIYMTEFEKPPSFAHDRRHIVDAYRQYQQIMEHWRAVIPEDRLLEIRYEDIVEDLEGSAKRMLDHCGLTWSPACLNFHRREGRVATPSVWQVRQPIYRGSVQKWRNYEPWLEEFAELLT